MIYRVKGAVQVFQGTQTNNSLPPTARFTGSSQFDIVLNTLTNTEPFYAGGTNTAPLYTTSGAADPFSSFNFVSIDAHRATGTFETFSPTVSSATPEPGAVFIVPLGLPLIGVARGRRYRRI